MKGLDISKNHQKGSLINMGEVYCYFCFSRKFRVFSQKLCNMSCLCGKSPFNMVSSNGRFDFTDILVANLKL